MSWNDPEHHLEARVSDCHLLSKAYSILTAALTPTLIKLMYFSAVLATGPVEKCLQTTWSQFWVTLGV